MDTLHILSRQTVERKIALRTPDWFYTNLRKAFVYAGKYVLPSILFHHIGSK